jgi:hypothetical protein
MGSRAVLMIVFVVTALLAACDRGPSRLSIEDLLERANAACDRANGEIDELTTVTTTDPTQVADDIDAVALIQRDLRDELASFRPPRDDEETYDRWLENVDAALEASGDVTAALREGDAAAQRAAIEAADAAAARADAAAIELGATACVAGAAMNDDGIDGAAVDPNRG